MNTNRNWQLISAGSLNNEAVSDYPRRLEKYEQALLAYREYEQRAAAYEQYISSKYNIKQLRYMLEELERARALVWQTESNISRSTSPESARFRAQGGSASALCGYMDVKAKAEIEQLSSEECEYLSFISGERFVSCRNDICSSCGSNKNVSKTISKTLCTKDNSSSTWNECLTCVRENKCHFTDYYCNTCSKSWSDR